MVGEVRCLLWLYEEVALLKVLLNGKKKKTKIRLKLNVLWSDIVFLKKSLTFYSRKFKIWEIKLFRRVSIFIQKTLAEHVYVSAPFEIKVLADTS